MHFRHRIPEEFLSQRCYAGEFRKRDRTKNLLAGTRMLCARQPWPILVFYPHL